MSTQINRPEAVISASSRTFDVVIIGAGIIGLTIARQFLIGSDLSVAVVDKAVPCSGATGAGKVYSLGSFIRIFLLVLCLFIEKMWIKERTREPLPYILSRKNIICVYIDIVINFRKTHHLKPAYKKKVSKTWLILDLIYVGHLFQG